MSGGRRAGFSMSRSLALCRRMRVAEKRILVGCVWLTLQWGGLATPLCANCKSRLCVCLFCLLRKNEQVFLYVEKKTDLLLYFNCPDHKYTYLLTLLTCLFTYLLAYLLYLPTCLLTCLFTYLITYFTYLLACLLAYLLYLLYLPTCLLTCLFTYLLTCLLTFCTDFTYLFTCLFTYLL
jgi:hypothetical protein